MKLSTVELYQLHQEARRHTPVGSVLAHKKGGIYIVTGHSFNTETLVIDTHYKRIGGPDFKPCFEQSIQYNRPDEMFTKDRFVDYG